MKQRQQNPQLAVALIVTATAFIAGTMLLAKTLGTETLGPALHPLQVSHGRFLFAFLAISIVALAMRPKFGKPKLRLHIGRTLFGWGGVSLMFAAAANMRLSDATAISFLNPVFAMILAIPLLGERVGPWRWGAAAAAMIGALILLRPGAETFQLAGLLALAAAFLMGMELIFLKKLADSEPPFQVLLINNGLGLMMATIAVIPVWMMPNGAQWAALVGIGVLMATAQACFVNAVARADASFVTPFSYITLIFATLYDGIVFSERPDHISLIGAALIIGGAILLAWREARTRS
ncbi:DMT family transporter [Loktanella sp. S4079]|uniref:DMT family transporter n=1 Tax=Loktanella sp. S4079 TaxID=579483 RepID=UPI0005F9C7D5|nr:DMT family transporter [Loktanella sp. S4079]KJZ20911.1 membrane protein [Loktanella sp. S4079]